MKRDIELLRTLLIKIEKQDAGKYNDIEISVEGVDSEIVNGHLRLLKEAGFIDADEIPNDEADFIYCVPTRLTWQGHDFLDSIRDQEIWAQTKAGVAKVGGVGVEFIWEIAKGYGKHMIKEKLGFDV